MVFEVIKASNGAEGVDLARQHFPDLIISDVNMSQMSGIAVLGALRGDAATATIPFILMTGQTDRVTLREGMNLGADDYLAKPFTMPELLGAVKARLQKSEAERKAAQVKL